MRIGIDVGGTHTDAVIFDDKNLIAGHKALTTDDIASGVLNAVRETLRQSSISPSAIECMTLGTTQFTNAVVQRRDLSSIGAIRIGAQSSSALPIAAKWPEDIKAAIMGADAMVDGGFEYNGAPIVPTDEKALVKTVEKFAAANITSIAVTSVFSTANASAEEFAADAIRQIIPHAKIALSHELGRIGIYQRENSTLLNAALLDLADMVITAFEHAFDELKLNCPFFISQNDGTLMPAPFARRYPVFTFSSGPTNSMRGAAFLSGQNNAMVVDVGGTTSDIGMLIDGFPRPSGSAVRIGGILTNFRMPDVIAVGLGGGSIVLDHGNQVGPSSVGSNLPQEGSVFGGNTLTATDIAVANGDANIGDANHVKSLDLSVIENTIKNIRNLYTDNIDKMKTTAGQLPLIVVGGGGFLVPDHLPGVSEIIRPANAGVANAIGAAFAQISGEAENIYITAKQSREDALSQAKKTAINNAVNAGAIEHTVTIQEIDESPMSYMEQAGAVIHVKAVGEADINRFKRPGGLK